MKIVLIGDSIRMGYMQGVRRRLGTRAEVTWPEANCGNSMQIRENLRQWAIDPRPDIVHLNAGIHDLGWMPEETVPRFTVGAYVRNLRIIIDRLRDGTDAHIIFATTTPFLIPLGPAPLDNCRPAPIVESYNTGAVKLMRKKGIEINDLYGAVMEAGVKECLSEDKIHMNDTGNAVLAEQVAEAIRENL